MLLILESQALAMHWRVTANGSRLFGEDREVEPGGICMSTIAENDRIFQYKHSETGM